MNGKVVLIVGAKGGLGTFVTKKFLEAGASVVGASPAIQASDFPHPRFVAMPADFTNDSAVRELVSQVVARHGKIDCLIQVMGGFAGGHTIADTDDATWARMRDLNLTAAFYAIRAVLPHMRKAAFGRIVAVGSLAADEPHAGIGAYVIFKSALATLIRTVALENADAHITANVVLPDTMDTAANRVAMPQADFSSWLKPEAVASLLLWLAADQSSQVNGAVIPVRGGATG